MTGVGVRLAVRETIRLPIWVNWEEGESLPSWIDRGAAQLEFSREPAWRVLGLTSGRRRQPAANGIDLTPAERTGLKQATGITDDQLNNMLLRRFDGTALDLSHFDATDPSAISRWSRRYWVPVWGSRCCPRCLQKRPGVWHLAWRLPWTIVCVEHRVWMLARCPRCGAPLQSEVLDPRQGSICCRPSTADGSNPHIAHSLPIVCGFPLADGPAVPASQWVVEIQQRLNELMAIDDRPTLDGYQATSSDRLQVFDDLRSIIKLGFAAGAVTLAGQSDRRSQTAWTRCVENRPNERLPGAVYARMEPLRLAVPLAAALKLVLSPDLDVGWADFLSRLQVKPPLTHWAKLDRSIEAMSQPHRDALVRQRNRSRVAISPELDGRLQRERRVRALAVPLKMIPPLLWERTSAALVTGLLEGKKSASIRQFTAIAVSRLIDPSITGWVEGAERLGQPPTGGWQSSRMSRDLRASGAGPIFYERLRVLPPLLEEYAANRVGINYPARKRRLQTFTDFSDDEWQRWCVELNIDAEQDLWRYRRLLLACLVWARLCSDDVYDAPAMIAVNQWPSRSRAFEVFRLREWLVTGDAPAAYERLCIAVRARYRLRGPVALDDLDARLANEVTGEG